MEFIDLKKQYQLYKEEIQEEFNKVLTSASFINGPAVKELEKQLAEYVGVKHAIGCSSGTDALLLSLMVKEVKPGDEVLIPDFTFIATAEVVALIGAVPVFIDIKPDTYNINPVLIEQKITDRTKGIIPVSLYGQCADFDEIQAVASKNSLWVIEDGAQSFGATYKGKKSCSITEIGTTSFFPAKPLGCYGDGGAVFTNDDSIAEKLLMLRNHGQERRYFHKIIGVNGRLDSIQAAVLKVKLKHFDDEMKRKQDIARIYTDRLKNVVKTPVIKEFNYSVWAQYTVQTEKRDEIVNHLRTKGIPIAIHYPKPLHIQEAFTGFGNVNGNYPISEKASREVFSLPMHPFLEEKDIDFICNSIKEAL